jgi:hypothetical protein
MNNTNNVGPTKKIGLKKHIYLNNIKLDVLCVSEWVCLCVCGLVLSENCNRCSGD